jgi:hypothetical protein
LNHRVIGPFGHEIIGDLSGTAGCSLGSCENCQEFIGLTSTTESLSAGTTFASSNNSNPIYRLVDFFDHQPHPRDELRVRPCSTRGPVVGGNRCRRSQQLSAERPALFRSGERAEELDFIQGEPLAPVLELLRFLHRSSAANPSMNR